MVGKREEPLNQKSTLICNDESTFQESLRSVQTLGRQLVVSERSQQLADHHIGAQRGLPRSHVVRDDLDSVLPSPVLHILEPIEALRECVER